MSIITDDANEVVSALTVPTDHLAGRAVLITGSTGMLGRYLVELMLALSSTLSEPMHVVAHARNETKAHRVFAGLRARPDFEIVIGDAAVPLAATARPVDMVVHAASPATPTQFRDDPVGVIRANVLGTFSLLDMLAARPDAYFSFISTMEIYGSVLPDHPGADVVLTESDVGTLLSTDLRSAYPESKRLAETLCVAYAAQYGIRSDIVRLSHTYGPGMDAGDNRVQAQFIRTALAGDDIVLQSDGSTSRTYTYVADAAAAVLYVLLTARTRSDTRAFNVADESSRTTIRNLAETVLTAAGRDPSGLRIELADPNAQMWSKVSGATYLDCAAIRALGWTAQHPLPEGMSRTIQYERDSAEADADALRLPR